MRHRFRRIHSARGRSGRLRWLTAGGPGPSVIDDCHRELPLIATRRGPEHSAR